MEQLCAPKEEEAAVAAANQRRKNPTKFQE